MADQMSDMQLNELYPLQATYYYQPQQEVYYQQSEASFATADSGFESHEVVSPPPGFATPPGFVNTPPVVDQAPPQGKSIHVFTLGQNFRIFSYTKVPFFKL